MSDSTKKQQFVDALSTAGKNTLKGVGVAAVLTLTVIAEAADIKKRDEIRQKLSGISDYDLEIAAEIIATRIKDKK